MAVGVGIIGLGLVAQTVHLPILSTMPDRYHIVAISDVSPRLVSAIGQQYGLPPARRFTDPAALYDRPDVDLVMVLSSDEYHAEQAIAALQHGKHVFIEKPICLTIADAEAIAAARDAAKRQVVVGYMRRFAPAFLELHRRLPEIGPIIYARVRDIIGRNDLITEQACAVLRVDDIDPEFTADRQRRAARMVEAAIGDVHPSHRAAYRLLCGLGSHDLSAMRELLGMPDRVIAADTWHGGRFLTAILGYDDFRVTFEMGVDQQRRFDAHIAIYGERTTLTVQYDTPFIRHLPTTLLVQQTSGDAYSEQVIRPTFTDPYTHELRHVHDVLSGDSEPKTTVEDSIADLHLFADIIANVPS